MGALRSTPAIPAGIRDVHKSLFFVRRDEKALPNLGPADR
jgi:hypothetical protein